MLNSIISRYVLTESNAHRLLDILLSSSCKENGSKLVTFVLRNALTNNIVRYISIKLATNIFLAPTPKVFVFLLHKLITLGFTPTGRRVVSYIITSILSNKQRNAKVAQAIKAYLISPEVKAFYSRCLDELLPNKMVRRIVRSVLV